MGKDAKWTYAELQNKFQNIDSPDFWKEDTIFVIENCIPLEKKKNVASGLKMSNDHALNE